MTYDLRAITDWNRGIRRARAEYRQLFGRHALLEVSRVILDGPTPCMSRPLPFDVLLETNSARYLVAALVEIHDMDAGRQAQRLQGKEEGRMNLDLLTDTGFCDGCLEERRDVETCECGITRCDQCRVEGCARCGPKPLMRGTT